MKRSNPSRRYSGGGPRPDLAKLKREEAVERQAAYDKLSVDAKIALLDSRKMTATKQRAKLANMLAGGNQQIAEQVVAEMNAEQPEERKRLKAKDRRKQAHNEDSE